jgi:GNAT superfamily N-acetyltransferase
MSPSPFSILSLHPAAFAQNLDRLAEILRGCVRERRLRPAVRIEAARAYWRERVAPADSAGGKVVLVAARGGTIVGTAQLDLDPMPTKRHHAEVSKVLVDPCFRRAGVARG